MNQYKNSNKVLFTVVTVVFNAVEIIEKTLKSVINQSHKNLEYIIIDGGSTDGTIDILNKYKNKISKIIVEKDSGIYDAMNKALSIANGDFLIFINAGDSFFSNMVLDDVSKKITDKTAIYYGNVYWVDEEQKRAFIYDGKFNVVKLCIQNICHQSLFYPYSVYKKYKYNLSYKILADYIYNLNLKASHYSFKYMDIVVSYYYPGISKGNDELFITNRDQIIKEKFGLWIYWLSILRKNELELRFRIKKYILSYSQILFKK